MFPVSVRRHSLFTLYIRNFLHIPFLEYMLQKASPQGETTPCGLMLQMFKFIADPGDTLNVVWKIQFKTQFLTQLTYMIMNRFSRIEITILFPNQIGNQFVSKNTFGIGNEQCQYIKLLTCQVDNPFPNPDSAMFQAQIKLALLYFCQRILLRCRGSVTGIECRSTTDSLIQNILCQIILLFLVKKQK